MNRNILIIEENSGSRAAVCAALAAAGYSVREAVDGKAGLAQMKEAPADLVIVDLRLHDVNAFELVAELRSVTGATHIPVLALTSFANTADEKRIGAAQFTDYLFKPVDIPLLVQTAHARLEPKDPPKTRLSIDRPILVIDDEPSKRKLLASQLRQVGFTVVTAADGVEGLAQAAACLPAAVVSNVSMPRIDGFQFCMQLRQNAALAAIPVVLLSDNDVQDADTELAKRAGASTLIQTSPDLQDTVQLLVDTLAGAPPPASENVPLLRAAHQERLVHQLERQTALNFELARRCAAQTTQISVLALMGGKFLEGSVSRPTLHNELVAQSIEAVGFSCGAILTFDGEHRLTLSAQIGFKTEAAKSLPRFFNPGGAVDALTLQAEPSYITLASDGVARARPFLLSIGAQAAFISPLRFGQEDLGVLLLASEAPLADLEWVDFAKAVTRQIAQVIALGQCISRLQHLASFDAMTGLPNCAYLNWQLQKVSAEGKGGALFLVHLDRFQEINSTLGSRNGSNLLRQVATRLRAHAPADALVARLGADEFAVLRTDTTSPETIESAALQTLKTLEPTLKLSGLPIALRATLGIAPIPAQTDDVDLILSNADTARRKAQSSGCDSQIYSERSEADFVDHLTLLGELREAIARNELALHYQPKVRVDSGETVGVEALLRWLHPERGWIMPDRFIPLAEKAGLIYPITLWVVGSALRQTSGWRSAGHRIGVAVNISAYDLQDPAFPDILANICHSTGTKNHELTLEFTEHILSADPARAHYALKRLSELGFELSLDDFGTGHCSVSELQALPLKEIKIDKSFIGNFVNDPRSDAIVRSMIGLGRHLGMNVVAEGIESRESWDALDDLGCDMGQGFFICRPKPPGEIVTPSFAWRADDMQWQWRQIKASETLL